MRKLSLNLLIIYTLLFLTTGYAGNNNDVTPRKPIPPGTVLLKGTKMYVDQVEISTFYWTEYRYGIKRWKKDSLQISFNSTLPDSAVLKSVYPTITQKSYWKKYANYPMVGITLKQAEDYCKFRTWAADSFLSINKPKLYKKYIIIYKIPTARQWAAIADSKQAEHKTPKDSLYPVHKIRYNKLLSSNKIYGMFDNVSEFVDSPDYCAMGGNWKEHKNVKQQIPKPAANKPKNWLGFRCVAFIVKRK